MALTPFPIKSTLVDKALAVTLAWSQWYTGLRNAVNQTPGNSVPVTFANLPVGVPGMLFVITDSTVNTWGAVIAGAGGFRVLGYFNGTNWTVAAV